MAALTKTQNSVAYHLLKAVFVLYFAFTFSLTVGHMTLEYRNTKAAIARELDLVQRSFAQSLSISLFDLNEDQLHAIIAGMVTLPAVTGVQIESIGDGVSLRAAQGTVLDAGGRPVEIDARGAQPIAASLFWHDFEIRDSDGDQLLGRGRVYSSTRVVYQQVQGIFAIILGGAVLKTLALWFLFLWAARSQLNRPITVLTAVLDSIDPDRSAQLKVSVDPPSPRGRVRIRFALPGRIDETITVHQHDEIHRLSVSFERMRLGIAQRINNLKLLGGLAEALLQCKQATALFEQVYLALAPRYHSCRMWVIAGYGAHHFQRLQTLPLPAAPGSAEDDVEAIAALIAPHLAGSGATAIAAPASAVLPEDVQSLLILPLSDGQHVLRHLVFCNTSAIGSLAEEERILLQAVARLAVISLKTTEMIGVIENHNRTLEQVVAQRTRDLRQAKDAAEASLLQLQQTQASLIEQEKMAALGSLVAGVAHEVNTPLGVALTAGSYLKDCTRDIARQLTEGSLRRSSFDEYITRVDESTRMIERNLERAAQLVSSFKQVSVDRTSDGRRRFRLDESLHDLLESLSLQWKRRPIQTQILCPPNLEFDSFPGAIGQIVTNLIQNALLHAFPDERGGVMSLEARELDPQRVELVFRDNGVGINTSDLKRIFEPFFTTRRGDGGTGLGLHILYNLVTQKLGGSIEASSALGVGTTIRLILPKTAPQSTQAVLQGTAQHGQAAH